MTSNSWLWERYASEVQAKGGDPIDPSLELGWAGVCASLDAPVSGFQPALHEDVLLFQVGPAAGDGEAGPTSVALSRRVFLGPEGDDVIGLSLRWWFPEDEQLRRATQVLGRGPQAGEGEGMISTERFIAKVGKHPSFQRLVRARPLRTRVAMEP